MSKLTTERLNELRAIAPKGSTVYTILCDVAKSGMSRKLKVLVLYPDGPRYLTFACAELGIGTYTGGRLRVHGCGMDMGFHVVSTLSRVLHGDDYALTHRWL